MYPNYDEFYDKIVNEYIASGKYFEVNFSGDWDNTKFMEEYKEHLIYADLRGKDRYLKFIMYFKGAATILKDGGVDSGIPFHIARIHGVTFVTSESFDVATRVRDELESRYSVPKKAQFKIFSVSDSYLQTRDSDLLWTPFSKEDLILSYGKNFYDWSESTFLPGIRNRSSSLSVFRGEPGTGKTSFLKHLIASMFEEVNFYYIPINVFGIFENISTIDRLMDIFEEDKKDKKKSVLIIEDAESLLAQRDGSNNSAISSLLNLSDGIIGSVMEVHIITTVNCEMDKVDSAFKRRGRVLTIKEFGVLSREEALDLASHKKIDTTHILNEKPGKKFTLAEIFNAPDSVLVEGEKAENQIGFIKNSN